MLTTEEAQAAAIAENLVNPDKSAITTEEQLTAARALAKANPPAEEEETPEEKAAREMHEAEEAAKNDPLLRALFEDRKTQDEIDQKIEEEAVIEAAPDPAADRVKNLATLKEWGIEMPDDATDDQIASKVAEGKPAPAAQPPVTPEKKKKKKFSVVKEEHADIVDQPPVERSNLAQVTPVTGADEDYIKTLTEEQQDELHEAEVAERLEPVTHKDQKKKLLDFYRRFDREVREIQTKEPGVELEENDQFKALAKAKPTLSAVIVKRVNRQIGSEQGAKAAKESLAPEIADVKMTQRRLEMTPKFQKFVVEAFKPGINTLIERDEKSPIAEAFKAIKEKGIAGAKEDGYALEAKIYDEEMTSAARRAEKFLLLKNNAVPFNQESPDPDHTFILEFIKREGNHVSDYEKKHGNYIDKARKFLPRAEFIRMLQTNPAEAGTLDGKAWKTKSFCTFTDTGILDALAMSAKLTIDLRIKQANERAAEVGFERRVRVKPSNTPNQPSKPVVEINPPRATPAAANGSGKPADIAQLAPTIDVLAINYGKSKVKG